MYCKIPDTVCISEAGVVNLGPVDARAVNMLSREGL